MKSATKPVRSRLKECAPRFAYVPSQSKIRAVGPPTRTPTPPHVSSPGASGIDMAPDTAPMAANVTHNERRPARVTDPASQEAGSLSCGSHGVTGSIEL
jgi:hypothetical protein